MKTAKIMYSGGVRQNTIHTASYCVLGAYSNLCIVGHFFQNFCVSVYVMTSRYVDGLGGALWAVLSEGKEFVCRSLA